MKKNNQTFHAAPFLAAVITFAAWNYSGAQLPQVPGVATTVYAQVPNPVGLAYGPDGSIYVGRDSGGATQDPEAIYRIDPTGSAAAFGNIAIRDPDYLVVDRTGSISGMAGAVLVGGEPSGITQVSPLGTVTTLFAPGSSVGNPNGMVIDKTGRLLFTDILGNAIRFSTGSTPQILFTVAWPGAIAVDETNRILVTSRDLSYVSLYTADGTLVNPQYVPTGQGYARLSKARGGFWGTDVYVVNSTGQLLRIHTDGSTSIIGVGFDNGDMEEEFGDDGALYVAQWSQNRILRISPLVLTIQFSCGGSCAAICWNSKTNKSYQVWYSSDLATNQWLNLGLPVTGAGTNTCVTDALTAGKRFYRVQELP